MSSPSGCRRSGRVESRLSRRLSGEFSSAGGSGGTQLVGPPFDEEWDRHLQHPHFLRKIGGADPRRGAARTDLFESLSLQDLIQRSALEAAQNEKLDGFDDVLLRLLPGLPLGVEVENGTPGNEPLPLLLDTDGKLELELNGNLQGNLEFLMVSRLASPCNIARQPHLGQCSLQ